MKRRSFTFGLAALGATPAIPSVSLASPISSGATQHFGLAKMLARTHNHCSKEMLMRHLRIDGAMAQQLETLLIQNGVITPPIGGVSMATKPLNTHCIPKEALKPTNLVKKVRSIKDRLKRMADTHTKQIDAGTQRDHNRSKTVPATENEKRSDAEKSQMDLNTD